MNFLKPRNKVLAARSLLALLLMASAKRAVSGRRLRVLTLAAVVGLCWWYFKARRSAPTSRFSSRPDDRRLATGAVNGRG